MTLCSFTQLDGDTTVATLNAITTSAFGPGTSIDAELQVASKTVTLVTTAFGSTSTSTWTITGDDAGDFIFVEHGAGAVWKLSILLIMENPRDANGDNVYEITLDTGGDALNAQLGVDHLVSTGDVDYTITITDDSADARPATPPTTPPPTTPPPVANSPIILRDADGNVVDSYTFSVDEGVPEGTTVGMIHSSVNNPAPGSRIFHQFLLTGAFLMVTLRMTTFNNSFIFMQMV